MAADVMTFVDVVHTTISQPEFLKEYDRLNGTTFTKGGLEYLGAST